MKKAQDKIAKDETEQRADLHERFGQIKGEVADAIADEIDKLIQKIGFNPLLIKASTIARKHARQHRVEGVKVAKRIRKAGRELKKIRKGAKA